MELSDSMYEEILKIVEAHPIGIGADSIFKKSTSFCDRQELATTLHLMKKEGVLLAIGGLYFTKAKASEKVSEVTKPNTVEQPKQEQSDSIAQKPSASRFVLPKRKKEPEVQSKEEPKPERLPFGTCRKGTNVGKVALAMYVLRNEGPIKSDDLCEMSGVKKPQFYASVYHLIKSLYIKESVKLHYEWSGSFLYPFSKLAPDDTKCLSYQLTEYKSRQARKNSAPYTPVSDTPEEKQKPVVEVIDADRVSSTSTNLEGVGVLAVKYLEAMFGMPIKEHIEQSLKKHQEAFQAAVEEAQTHLDQIKILSALREYLDKR